MDIFRIAAVGIISALIAVTLRAWRPELAAAVGIAAGLVLILGMADTLFALFSQFEAIIDGSGIDTQYFMLVLKLIGIAYITKFAADICRDSGESAIASKVELAGKAAVLALTVPVIGSFLSLVIETMNAF